MGMGGFLNGSGHILRRGHRQHVIIQSLNQSPVAAAVPLVASGQFLQLHHTGFSAKVGRHGYFTGAVFLVEDSGADFAFGAIHFNVAPLFESRHRERARQASLKAHDGNLMVRLVIVALEVVPAPRGGFQPFADFLRGSFLRPVIHHAQPAFAFVVRGVFAGVPGVFPHRGGPLRAAFRPG